VDRQWKTSIARYSFQRQAYVLYLFWRVKRFCGGRAFARDELMVDLRGDPR